MSFFSCKYTFRNTDFNVWPKFHIETAKTFWLQVEKNEGSPPTHLSRTEQNKLFFLSDASYEPEERVLRGVDCVGVSYVGSPNAEHVVICMGSAASVIEEVLRAQFGTDGLHGLLKVRRS